jgi:hypothetical protein
VLNGDAVKKPLETKHPVDDETIDAGQPVETSLQLFPYKLYVLLPHDVDEPTYPAGQKLPTLPHGFDS